MDRVVLVKRTQLWVIGKYMINTILLMLVLAFLLGFSVAFLYIVRRSKVMHRRTGGMLKDDLNEKEVGVIEGRLQISGELIDALQFKKFK